MGASVRFGRQLVDEVEKAVVRPVEVLDDEHERRLLGQGLEEVSPGRKRLVSRLSPRLALAGKADEHARSAIQALLLLGKSLLDCEKELLLDHLGTIALEHPRLCLDDLAERPEGDAVAIGKGAAFRPRDPPGVGLDKRARARGRAASCRSRDAEDRHELRRPLHLCPGEPPAS